MAAISQIESRLHASPEKAQLALEAHTAGRPKTTGRMFSVVAGTGFAGERSSPSACGRAKLGSPRTCDLRVMSVIRGARVHQQSQYLAGLRLSAMRPDRARSCKSPTAVPTARGPITAPAGRGRGPPYPLASAATLQPRSCQTKPLRSPSSTHVGHWKLRLRSCSR